MQLGTLCCSRAGTSAAALHAQSLYTVVLCAACLYKAAKMCLSREKVRSAAVNRAEYDVCALHGHVLHKGWDARHVL